MKIKLSDISSRAPKGWDKKETRKKTKDGVCSIALAICLSSNLHGFHLFPHWPNVYIQKL